MLMVGVGEVVLGNGRHPVRDLDYIKSRSWFNDGAYVTDAALSSRREMFLRISC